MPNKVLIVDDDRFIQKVLTNYLKDSYEISVASNADEALAQIEKSFPNMILLDVEMPGRNGYELCEILKSSESTKKIPVIFLSAKSSVRERMLGFEAGGEDYLVKPCEQELLLAKLDRIHAYNLHQQNLEDTADVAQKTAMEALSTSSEMGKTVRFIERCNQSTSIDQLAKEFSVALRDFDLNASFMLIGMHSEYFFSTYFSEVSPLEQELIQMLSEGKRFTDFGCRTQISYANAVLLVKNMPLDDPNKYGRLKDMLPFMLESVDAKMRVLEAESQLSMQNKELTKTIVFAQQTLDQVKDTLFKHQNNVHKTMAQLNINLMDKLTSLGLEDDQEEYILGQVDGANTNLMNNFEESGEVQEALSTIIKVLKKLCVDQNKIVQQTLTQKVEAQPDTGGDVELF